MQDQAEANPIVDFSSTRVAPKIGARSNAWGSRPSPLRLRDSFPVPRTRRRMLTCYPFACSRWRSTQSRQSRR